MRGYKPFPLDFIQDIKELYEDGVTPTNIAYYLSVEVWQIKYVLFGFGNPAKRRAYYIKNKKKILEYNKRAYEKKKAAKDKNHPR